MYFQGAHPSKAEQIFSYLIGQQLLSANHLKVTPSTSLYMAYSKNRFNTALIFPNQFIERSDASNQGKQNHHLFCLES